RGAHQAQEVATALRVGELGGVGRELTVQELLHFGRAGQLIQASPIRTAARFRAAKGVQTRTNFREIHRKTGAVRVPYRWHVEAPIRRRKSRRPFGSVNSAALAGNSRCRNSCTSGEPASSSRLRQYVRPPDSGPPRASKRARISEKSIEKPGLSVSLTGGTSSSWSDARRRRSRI